MGKCSDISASYAPVSYTHLDVYKRQVYDRKNSYTDKIQKAKISEQMRVSLELRDIRDCENETYGCKKEKGIKMCIRDRPKPVCVHAGVTDCI